MYIDKKFRDEFSGKFTGVLLAKITYLKKSALFLADNSGIQYC